MSAPARSMHPVALIVRDPDLESGLRALVESLEGFREVPADDVPEGALLFYELGPDPAEELEEVLDLVEAGKVREAFLAAQCADPELLIRAMRAGIKEFFTVSHDPEQLAAEITPALERYQARCEQARKLAPAPAAQPEARGRILSFMGSKGGMGTTTIAVNLAAALANAGAGSVAVLDLRRPQGEVPFFLDLEYTYTWADAVGNLDRLDESFLEGLLARHPSGIKVLPAPGIQHDESDLGPHEVETLLKFLSAMFDYVIVDGNCAMDESSLKVMELSENVYMTLVLSLPCLANVKKFLDTLENLDSPVAARIRLVVNRHMSSSEIGVDEAETVVGRKMSWLIPNEYTQTLSAINQGKPLVEAAPKSAVTKAFLKFAGELGASKPKASAAPGGSFIRKLFKRSAQAAA